MEGEGREQLKECCGERIGGCIGWDVVSCGIGRGEREVWVVVGLLGVGMVVVGRGI